MHSIPVAPPPRRAFTPAGWLPVLLALLAGACVSAEHGGGGPATPESGRSTRAGGGSAGGGTSGAREETPDAADADAKRTQMYLNIDLLSDQWEILKTEPGETASRRARGLEAAIAREVSRDFDRVLADLESGDNPRWRRAAARGMGFVVNPRARPALEKALQDTDPWLLSAALVSLGVRAETGTDVERVGQILAHPDPVVRGNAALCLARVFQARNAQGLLPLEGENEVQELEAALFALLFDPADAIVRGNAAQALGHLASAGAEEALLNGLRDTHAFVRLKSVQALGNAGTARSLPPLLELLGREQKGNLRDLTALTLGAIAERDGRNPPIAELGTDAAKWRRWLER